jgi:phage baseplate assembly protein gpV
MLELNIRIGAENPAILLGTAVRSLESLDDFVRKTNVCFGKVFAVDPITRRCRVRIDQSETDYLPWIEQRKGEKHPPSKGDVCVVFTHPSRPLDGLVILSTPVSDDFKPINVEKAL